MNARIERLSTAMPTGSKPLCIPQSVATVERQWTDRDRAAA